MKKARNQSGISNDRTFKTSSAIELAPVYGDGPYPGEFPFTRGPYRTMYRQKPWTMRQYSGFGSAAETNQRFHYLLKNGQTGVSCAFDLPTQMGYDSDHAMADGEVGRVGVAISTIEDMQILLNRLPLNQISTSMTINSTASTLLALYAAVAKKNKVALSEIRGTIQNDILKEYVARGTYIYPPDFSLKLIADTFRFTNLMTPKFNSISISGYHIREAGSTAAQEIAFTLQNAFTYIETALKSGLKAEDFVPRLSFFFNVHNHFFEEIAKFRVARKIYAEEVHRRFGVAKEMAVLRFHAQTAGSTLTAQQPLNNAIRVAYQAMAAVLGGAQSLHTNSFDEALALPTEKSALLALRTQQILLEETGLVSTADPLAGAGLVEFLTTELEAKAKAIIERIDSQGGMLRSIETGWVSREIQNAAFEAQKAIDSATAKVVGVNSYQMNEEAPSDLHQLNPKVVKDQLARLKKFKSKRKAKRVDQAIKDLSVSAGELHKTGKSDVCEKILAAVESHVTLGEISDALRLVAGTHR